MVLGTLDSWAGDQLPVFPFLEKGESNKEDRIEMLFDL